MTKNVAVVFTDGISNNDDEMPKPILTQMKKKKTIKQAGVKLWHNRTSGPTKISISCFFFFGQTKANLEYLINIVELHTVAP